MNSTPRICQPFPTPCVLFSPYIFSHPTKHLLSLPLINATHCDKNQPSVSHVRSLTYITKSERERKRAKESARERVRHDIFIGTTETTDDCGPRIIIRSSGNHHLEVSVISLSGLKKTSDSIIIIVERGTRNWT